MQICLYINYLFIYILTLLIKYYVDAFGKEENNKIPNLCLHQKK